MKMQDHQVYEILEQVDKLATNEEKVNLLRRYNDHTPLRYVLKWNYDATVKTILPEGTPPFNAFEEDSGPAPRSLWNYLQIFGYFVKSGTSEQMPMIKIERSFIDLLENVDAKEAEVIIATKDNALHKTYNLATEVVKAAFPDLLVAPEIVEPVQRSPKEIAEALIKLANQKKQQAKDLNAEAKRLTQEAKELREAE